MNRRIQISILSMAVVGILLLGGCNKKVAKAIPPSPPPPPATPTAALSASPDIISQGQSTQLTWQTTNADQINIEGLGTVAASGSRTVSPTSSITYTLMAKGPGGTRDASTRVTVNPMRAMESTPAPSEADLFAKNVRDVYFDFDKYSIRPDESPIAQSDAAFLAQHPDIKVLIAGHCDDRGSEEYNLALGASRANSVKQALEQDGVSAAQIKTISYGKEKPFCNQDDEQCWQQNRRDHINAQN